jgi:hypothetical protein
MTDVDPFVELARGTATVAAFDAYTDAEADDDVDVDAVRVTVELTSSTGATTTATRTLRRDGDAIATSRSWTVDRGPGPTGDRWLDATTP